jgi:hypothetical protein
MAAKDETGKLTQVPGLILENEIQLRRFCEGKMIKQFSHEKRKMLKSDLLNLSEKEILALCENERCEIKI